MKSFASCLVALGLLFAAGCQPGPAVNDKGVPETLRVGLIPNISPERQKALYSPFGDYLAKELDTKVELFVATDYAGVVTALASDRIDVAYVGGLTYAQAEKQAKVTALVTEIDRETGTREYISAIVVPTGSPHRSVKDLLTAKAEFAFGDVSSTSGSLYPRVMLADAGADCSTRDLSKCPPLSKVVFTGGHDAAAQAVVNGSADAAGLELRILHHLERQGAVPKGKLAVIAKRNVMGYPWIARDDLGEKAQEAIASVFERIKDPKLLELMRAKGYTRVTPSDYDDVRRQAEKLGLLKSG